MAVWAGFRAPNLFKIWFVSFNRGGGLVLSPGVNCSFYTSENFLVELKGLILFLALFKLRKGQFEIKGEGKDNFPYNLSIFFYFS